MILKLSIQSNLRELKTITEIILDSCQNYTYDDLFRNDIRLVIEEIVVNIIKHGYDECPEQRIDLEIDINATEFIMTVVDGGKPFNPLDFQHLKANHSLDDMDIGGQGINLVKQVSQHIEYKRLDNENRLTVTLKTTC